MPIPSEKIVAAAKVLEGFRVNILVGGTMFAVPAPQIEALMVLVQAAPQIAERFGKRGVGRVLRFGLFAPLPDSPLFGEAGLLPDASTRVRNCFTRAGLTTVRALKEYQGHVLDLHDFGRKSLAEVREQLGHLGIDIEEYPCLERS